MAIKPTEPGNRPRSRPKSARRTESTSRSADAARKPGQRKVRSKRKRETIQHPVLIVTTDADEPLTWQETLKQWVRGFIGAACGVSVLLHLLLLLLLSLFMLAMDTHDELPISSGFSTVATAPLEEIGTVSLDLPEPTETVSIDEVLVFDPTPEPAAPTVTVPGGQNLGKSIGFRMPSGGRAVTKGRFTAWTVPEDPKPREDYLIVIQVELPPDIGKYRQEDLSGFLEGDDGYKTPIGSYRGREFPRKYYGRFDMRARQFVIKIPGGAAKVKDTIEIESKVLKEKQRLVIVF